MSISIATRFSAVLLGPVTAKLCKMAIQERGRPQISKEWAT
jgi:hypothetical protein